MTSISGTSSSSVSPLQRLQSTLQSDVTSGKVNSADQSALSGALGDIDSALKANGPPTAGTDPSSIQTKIQSLIDQEVSSGKLTADQATELKQVFTDAKPSGGPETADGTTDATGTTGGSGHVHGHHHHHKSSSTDSDSASTSSTTSTSDLLASLTGTSSTSSTSTDPVQSAVQNLVSFLQNLTSATSAANPYSSTGSTTSSTATSMLVDQLA